MCRLTMKDIQMWKTSSASVSEIANAVESVFSYCVLTLDAIEL
jgi:hypothetical protein